MAWAAAGNIIAWPVHHTKSRVAHGHHLTYIAVLGDYFCVPTCVHCCSWGFFIADAHAQGGGGIEHSVLGVGS